MNLTQFRDWSLGQGSVPKYNDGNYLGECVSLVNQYCYRVLGVPAGAWGHAYAWGNDSNANVRTYFDKVSSIQAGDIIVYGTNFTPTYGHIGIALGGGKLLDQNGRISRKVAIGAIYNGYSTILRRKGAAPIPAPVGGDVAKVDTGLNRIVHSEMEGWPFDETHAGKFDGQFAAAWGGRDLVEMIWEKWNKNGAFRAERERNRKFYATYSGVVGELSSRPSKAELEDALAKLEQANKALVEEQAKKSEDTVLLDETGNWLQKLIKRLFGG